MLSICSGSTPNRSEGDDTRGSFVFASTFNLLGSRAGTRKWHENLASSRPTIAYSTVYICCVLHLPLLVGLPPDDVRPIMTATSIKIWCRQMLRRVFCFTYACNRVGQSLSLEWTDCQPSQTFVYTRELCPCVTTDNVGINIGYVLLPVS